LAGGVEGGKNPTTYKMGDTVNITSAPTRDGYTFVGWYIGDPADAKPTLTLPKDISGNIMVRALWEEAKLLFGTYEQDNNLANGAEDIEWLVLEKKDGKALLLSKYALVTKPYNEEDTDVTWESCTLRSWLNGEFYKAISDHEVRISNLEIKVDAESEEHKRSKSFQ
jgi:uncharacterized repeat protein (TIGR02543 family)